MTYPSEDAARRALLDTCLRMNAEGINQGKSGNVSLRWHRGGRDGLLISASGLPYEDAGIDDVVWMPLDTELPETAAGTDYAGTPWGAPGAVQPSSEWRMHLALHRQRDAVAVVHTHSPHATALACLPSVQAAGIPAFHYMVAAAGGTDIRCARYETFGTHALSDAMLAAIDGRRACLLGNHGVIAFGASLKAAYALASEVESLAKMYAVALSLAPTLGAVRILDDAEMQRVLVKFRHYGPGARD